MAKRKTSTPRSRKKPVKKQSAGILTFFNSLVNEVRNDPTARERWRKSGALFFILICIFALLACISYFYTGPADQSVVEGGTRNIAERENWLGFAGAKVADLLIHKGFGIISLLIPIYGIFVGLAFLEDNFYSTAKKLLKYVVFILVWVSAFLSYITILLNTDKTGDLGGGFGHGVNFWLFDYIGKIGVAFLLIFIVLIFVVVIFNAEIRASHLLEKFSSVKENVKQQTQARQNKPTAIEDTPKKSWGQQLKERLGLVSTNDIKEADKQSEERKINPKPKPEKKEEAVTGNEIALEVATETTITGNDNGNKKDGDQLELVIEPPVEEKKLEQIGEDNIGKVIGADTDAYEKIIKPEDEVIDLDKAVDWEAFDPTKELSGYKFPGLDLLTDYGGGQGREVSREELEDNKNRIVKTLKDYGIEIIKIKATVGPTVTLYEIVPAPGIRISKIRNLEDDIALSLAALGIRIIAPIPGKGTIGIEIPNSKPETVSLKGVLSTEKFLNTKAELPIAIGRTISNEVYVADLNKMPHLLIAGATGQGKSVGINTVIASLLYKKHPAEIKFVLIDPKKVELNLYQSLSHHFLAKLPDMEEAIVTDTKDAIHVLKSLSYEMDLRYNLLKKARVRNLKEYNTKFTNRKLNPRKGHRFLPYIILIIDELADMMMVAGKEVELPIARLAQLARAVGMHLVVATQRPSVNVITGVIKANFPARMSYRVISKVDSRTILDANGADQLVGRGDVLLSTGSDLIRIQNAFIDTPEVERLVDFISDQRGFPEPYFLPEMPGEDDDKGTSAQLDDKDELFEDAAKLVVRYQMGSASLIQRKLKLGYNRAGRIIDQLEQVGIVGPHSGSKARDVLYSDESELERYLNSL